MHEAEGQTPAPLWPSCDDPSPLQPVPGGVDNAENEPAAHRGLPWRLEGAAGPRPAGTARPRRPHRPSAECSAAAVGNGVSGHLLVSPARGSCWAKVCSSPEGQLSGHDRAVGSGVRGTEPRPHTPHGHRAAGPVVPAPGGSRGADGGRKAASTHGLATSAGRRRLHGERPTASDRDPAARREETEKQFWRPWTGPGPSSPNRYPQNERRTDGRTAVPAWSDRSFSDARGGPVPSMEARREWRPATGSGLAGENVAWHTSELAALPSACVTLPTEVVTPALQGQRLQDGRCQDLGGPRSLVPGRAPRGRALVRLR